MNSHKCSVCLGGGYKLWSNGLPSLSSCPICSGSGRISDVMPVADALADAETLRGMYSETVGLSFVGSLDDIRTAEVIAARSLYSPVVSARDAARAAFRAVPGLRGDK